VNVILANECSEVVVVAELEDDQVEEVAIEGWVVVVHAMGDEELVEADDEILELCGLLPNSILCALLRNRQIEEWS
jgi:hypothetical protein